MPEEESDGYCGPCDPCNLTDVAEEFGAEMWKQPSAFHWLLFGKENAKATFATLVRSKMWKWAVLR